MPAVPPHTPYGGMLHHNAFCPTCGGSCAIACTAKHKSVWLDPKKTETGRYVIELSPVRRPQVALYNPILHAGWPRYGEHKCP